MAVKPGSPIWVPPSAAAQIGGETLPPLILNAIGTRYFIDARLDGMIRDGTIESTTQGAPTLTLTVVDPDRETLNSDLFTRRIDLVIDNVPFRLVQVSRQEDELLELQFEHRLCSWLREHTNARKASRGTKTRAEFAYSLVLEVKKEPVIFISPDMHKKQPRAAKIDRATKDSRKAPGFLDNATNLKIKTAPATRSQLKEVDKALSVAAGLNASPLATKAMVCAGIGESSFVASATDFKTHTHKGVFQSNVVPQYDTEQMAHYFLVGGHSFLAGGAMGLAKRRPPLSPGAIAIMTEISDASGASFYDRYADEAQKLIDAWRGASGSEGGLSASATTGYPKLEFTRGAIQKGDAEEDSWVALQRLADEVRWRCFIDGRNVLYFVSDEQLMRSRPLYLVDPETPGVRDVTFDLEVGKRTVVYKGRRIHKPNEAILKARMGRWAAPPGSVIELAGYGLADGRWLIDSMTRGIFDAEAEVHLRQPQTALREPAAGTTSGGTSGTTDGTTGGSLGSGGDGSAAGTYVFPMGSGLTWGRIDMGVDFAGAGVIKAAGRAKVTRVSPQGSGTGWPGAGDGGRGNNGAMVVIQLLNGSQKGKYIYLAENIDPSCFVGDTLDAGQVYAHARGQFPYLEIGWAHDAQGRTLASATTGYSEGQQTDAGKSFAKWLHYLESRQQKSTMGPNA